MYFSSTWSAILMIFSGYNLQDISRNLSLQNEFLFLSYFLFVYIKRKFILYGYEAAFPSMIPGILSGWSVR